MQQAVVTQSATTRHPTTLGDFDRHGNLLNAGTHETYIKLKFPDPASLLASAYNNDAQNIRFKPPHISHKAMMFVKAMIDKEAQMTTIESYDIRFEQCQRWVDGETENVNALTMQQAQEVYASVFRSSAGITHALCYGGNSWYADKSKSLQGAKPKASMLVKFQRGKTSYVMVEKTLYQRVTEGIDLNLLVWCSQQVRAPPEPIVSGVVVNTDTPSQESDVNTAEATGLVHSNRGTSPQEPQDFDVGDEVIYASSATGPEPALILEVHREDTEPYYTVLVLSTGRERQTMRERLTYRVVGVDDRDEHAPPSPPAKRQKTSHRTATTRAVTNNVCQPVAKRQKRPFIPHEATSHEVIFPDALPEVLHTTALPTSPPMRTTW